MCSLRINSYVAWHHTTVPVDQNGASGRKWDDPDSSAPQSFWNKDTQDRRAVFPNVCPEEHCA